MAASSRAAPEALSPTELPAWHGMLSVHARVMRDLDRSLQSRHGIGVAEFDVLITLFNAPPEGMRMTDLAEAIMLSPAGLTHMVTRMERDRLVVRRVAKSDRRSNLVSLTSRGRARLDEAHVTHNEVVRSRFLDRLTAQQHVQLARAWAAIAD